MKNKNEHIDTRKPTMTDEEMVKDYPRLSREYALLHQDYREAIRKPFSNQRELLLAFTGWLYGNLDKEVEERIVNDYLNSK